MGRAFQRAAFISNYFGFARSLVTKEMVILSVRLEKPILFFQIHSVIKIEDKISEKTEQ